MKWFTLCLKKYATFNRRSQRSEYWYFALFFVLFYFALSIVDGFLGTSTKKSDLGLLSGLFMLGTLIPAIAVTTRRLHDIGKSGWWQLISLVPLLGTVLLLFWLAKDSDPQNNAYGENPKAAA